jgi:hypothetical protein
MGNESKQGLSQEHLKIMERILLAYAEIILRPWPDTRQKNIEINQWG